MGEEYVSLHEAADSLGVSERTVRRWIKSGKLRAYQPGRKYMIPVSAIDTLRPEYVIRLGRPYAEKMEELLGVHDPVLHEDDVADRVARAYLQLRDARYAWTRAQVVNGFERDVLHRKEREFNRALEEYERIMGEEK